MGCLPSGNSCSIEVPRCSCARARPVIGLTSYCETVCIAVPLRMFEDKAVAAVMEPMTDIVQSASEGRSALSDAHDKVSHLAGVDMPMEEPVAPPAAPDPEWPEQPANFVALSKLPHPLPAPPAAKSTDQAGRANMAGQPF